MRCLFHVVVRVLQERIQRLNAIIRRAPEDGYLLGPAKDGVGSSLGTHNLCNM
jgi:hypothetical protein